MTNQESGPPTAVITGAGSGIGRALALRAARAGMRVAITDVSADALGETARLVTDLGGECSTFVVDVRDEAAMVAFANAVPGPIGLVFANAGVLRIRPVAELSLELFKFMFDVNVLGVVCTIQVFLPRLLLQDIRSRIVLLGSMMSFLSGASSSGYAGTKHAVWAIAQALHAEMAADGARVDVSMVAPGPVATAIFDAGGSSSAEPGAGTPRELGDGDLTPDQAADEIFAGIARGALLIPTHPDDLPGMIRDGYEAAIRALGPEAPSRPVV